MKYELILKPISYYRNAIIFPRKGKEFRNHFMHAALLTGESTSRHVPFPEKCIKYPCPHTVWYMIHTVAL
jgi:hypothetical protein